MPICERYQRINRLAIVLNHRRREIVYQMWSLGRGQNRSDINYSGSLSPKSYDGAQLFIEIVTRLARLKFLVFLS